MQPHYLENFVQSTLETVCEEVGPDLSGELLVVGGDGRYYNRNAIQIILRIAAGNGVGQVFVGKSGLLSTPAMSAVIRRRKAMGGFILSASHNPGGPDADFGIKYNGRNGGPATEALTERIFARTQRITAYRVVEAPDIELDREAVHLLGTTRVTVVDPLADYTALMESLFDFEHLRKYLKQGAAVLFDAMHGVTGPYARHIFIERLGAPEHSLIHATPQTDFL